MSDLRNLASVAAIAAKQASEHIIMPYYHSQEFEVEHKPDAGNSPVTIADKKADLFLKEHLLAQTPDYGWLSEEIEDDPDRLTRQRVWIVDPIDGTKSFIRQGNRFTVSIGLVERDDAGLYHPILGVIYAPVTGRLFTATKGGGLWVDAERVEPAPNMLPFEEQLALIGLSEQKKGLLDPFVGKFRMDNNPSLAHKLALVAVGEADFMFTLRPKSDWDTAAGHVMCEEMNIQVTDLKGKPITYNREQTEMGGMIVASPETHQELSELISKA